MCIMYDLHAMFEYFSQGKVSNVQLANNRPFLISLRGFVSINKWISSVSQI